MKKKIISLAGELGAGKTTVTNLIQQKLKYPIHRNGEYFRKLAAQNNMSVTEFNEYVEKHPEIDMQIEKSARQAADSNDKLIIDARLGWYAVPESFKVYMTVDLEEAAKRAFNDPNRKKTENFNTIEEQKQDIEKRFNLENERYFNLYGIHKEDKANYDFIIDTTKISKEEVAQKIIEAFEKWLEE